MEEADIRTRARKLTRPRGSLWEGRTAAAGRRQAGEEGHYSTWEGVALEGMLLAGRLADHQGSQEVGNLHAQIAMSAQGTHTSCAPNRSSQCLKTLVE
jgi:hypothetical protein